MQIKFIFFIMVLGYLAFGSAQYYIKKEIGAWHFHTYFFEVNKRSVEEMLSFRRALRAQINNGVFRECSLNAIYVGWDGPHPVSQFEMCCNKSSFAVAHSFHTQNHGNLSVLIHPLTIADREDHVSRTSWIGKPLVLDDECPCLYPILPKPRPCPIYPEFSDELPAGDVRSLDDSHPIIPGTEDYRNRDKGFDILKDPY